MTQVTFQTATIADVIRQVSVIAPRKGRSFDQAAGIILEIDPAGLEPVVVKATNLDIWMRIDVDTVECTGEAVTWRVSSNLLIGIMAGLPISPGSQVTIRSLKDRAIEIVCGRIKARLVRMDHTYYPAWQAFDASNLVEIPGFGARVGSVSWACHASEVPLSGVCIDGEHITGTNKYCIAAYECKLELADPIVVPLGALAGTLKSLGDAPILVGTSGTELYLMPDDHTQISARMYDHSSYPRIGRAMVRNQPASITVNRDAFVTGIQRTMTMAKLERMPSLTLRIGDEDLGFYVVQKERGDLFDGIDLVGQALHPETEFLVDPESLVDAISNCPGDMITLHYDPDKTDTAFWIEGGHGYEAWIKPRKKMP